MDKMKILVLGDVSRSSSCDYLAENLRRFQRENDVCFTVVNGENSAEGNGIDVYSAKKLFSAGAEDRARVVWSGWVASLTVCAGAL